MIAQPELLDDSEKFDADVAIIGAGPVGLLLANMLGARGIRTLVFDQRIGPLTGGSMAIGVTPPSLEILKTLGLDTALREAGVPVRHAEVHESRACLGRLDFAGIESDYPFFLSIPQVTTVEILRRNLKSFPNVHIHEGAEFVNLKQMPADVSLQVRNVETGDVLKFRAHFLVGCDGHRSHVRASAGFEWTEKQYPQHFIMADFRDQSDLGDEARLFFSPEASVESFPLPGGWRRWILLVADETDEAPVAYLAREVKRLTGYELSSEGVRFVSAFGAKRLVVDCYFKERVLLAGDSAHVMSSIGGQGMNTGFADAEMLAEVLAQVLAQPEKQARSFDAYDRIRRAAFEAAAGRAERGMWLGTLRGKFASKFRRFIISRLLFSRHLQHRLAPHFAMLTIPFRNLNHVPKSWLALR